jgi:glycerate-2-kinase
MQIKDSLKNSFLNVLENIEPSKLIENKCEFSENTIIINNEEIKLPKDKNIHLFGSGKAVLSMAKTIYSKLEGKIEKSVLVGAYENEQEFKNLRYIQSSHPIPTQKSVHAAETLKENLEALNEDDFFIYLLSGGNSALVELPVETISLEDFQETTDLMLKGSMPIEAMNCIRKHLSQVKGGRLSSNCKAKGIVLVLSDVISNNIEAIGSAPLYFDSTSFEDAINYLKEYKLFEEIPLKVKEYLLEGLEQKIADTPKEENKNISHYLVGSNELLLEDIKKELEKNSIEASILDKKIEENVDDVITYLLEFIKDKEEGCFIFGGEALVKVTKENAKGGRNQHLVLSFLDNYPKDKNITFLSAASDGIDGNSLSAGAIIDKNCLKNSKDLNLDIKKYLEDFNSNIFLEKIGSLINSGPSHNNMLDVLIVHIEKKD